MGFIKNLKIFECMILLILLLVIFALFTGLYHIFITIPFIIGYYIELLITGDYVRCSNRIKLILDKASIFGKMIGDFWYYSFYMSVEDEQL